MKERILKLCKRLNKFSQADIETISGLRPYEITPILYELQKENLIEEVNGVYYYLKYSLEKHNINMPIVFQYHTKETVQLILKCFCADIQAEKVSLITNLSRNSISVFFNHFRTALYNKQLQELNCYFSIYPKIPLGHTFYDEKLYFYYYHNNIYISDKELKSVVKVEKHPINEIKIIHNFHCKLRRLLNNSTYKQSLAKIAYSKHWLHIKNQSEKLSELYNLLNIS